DLQVGRNGLVRELAQHSPRGGKLCQVCTAAVTTRDVILKPGPIRAGKGPFEVIGHELDHLAACHRRYSSSIFRTDARARCRRTLWFSSEIERRPHTSSALRPATSRSVITSRCFAGRASIASFTR